MGKKKRGLFVHIVCMAGGAGQPSGGGRAARISEKRSWGRTLYDNYTETTSSRDIVYRGVRPTRCCSRQGNDGIPLGPLKRSPEGASLPERAAPRSSLQGLHTSRLQNKGHEHPFCALALHHRFILCHLKRRSDVIARHVFQVGRNRETIWPGLPWRGRDKFPACFMR